MNGRVITRQPKADKENALLRASLWLTARALKDYHDAPHFEIAADGRPMLEVIVPEALHAKAEKMLKDEGRCVRGVG